MTPERRESDRKETVFLVDDDESVREGLESLLESTGMDVRVFSSADEFLSNGPSSDAAGCLVLDVEMPGMSGLDLQHQLKVANIRLPVIFLTGHGDIPMTVHALKAGAVHFLTKPVREPELMDVIRQALETDRAARRERASIHELQGNFDSLTRRQREVMTLVVAGKLNKQIAHELGTSERTIKLYRSQVMQKLRADSLADLVKKAERLGIGGTTAAAHQAIEFPT
jgi:FixJ family two-component response regulator